MRRAQFGPIIVHQQRQWTTRIRRLNGHGTVQIIGPVCDIADDGGEHGHQLANNCDGHDGPSKPVLVMDQAGLFAATIGLLPFLACCVDHEAEQNATGNETKKPMECPIDGNAKRSLLEGNDAKHDLLIRNARREAGNHRKEEKCEEQIQRPAAILCAKPVDQLTAAGTNEWRWRHQRGRMVVAKRGGDGCSGGVLAAHQAATIAPDGAHGWDVLFEFASGITSGEIGQASAFVTNWIPFLWAMTVGIAWSGQ